MAEEVPLSRKEKKAQRDAERHKKGKKRKLADTEEDAAAAENALEENASDAQTQKSAGVSDKATEATQTTPAESRSERRRRKSQDGITETEKPAASSDATSAKKRRKKNNGAAVETAATNGEATGEEAAKTKPTKSRFILFIGNLPFKTTDASLEAHFKKLAPFTLRHRTDPKTKKSKGFAFLEFENYDRMKTCLKLYHHSMFDPEDKENGGSGKGNGKNARRINVELTAGGGGKAEGRKEKIKVKNQRLEEQRKRRAEAERKAGERKEKKERAKGKKEGTAEGTEKAPALADQKHEGMHPARLARLNA